MRAFVGDSLGKCRILDVWNDSTISRIGGDMKEAPNREWECDYMKLISDSEILVLHKNGFASFFDVEQKCRNCVVGLKDVKNGYCADELNNVFYACFDNKIVSFNKESQIGSFEIVPNPSCAAINDGLCAIGRINDKAVLYDVKSEKQIWTAADPPLDELKLSIPDDDRSIIFIDRNAFLIGQNESVVLMYDQRVGDKPIIRQKVFQEFSIVSLCKLNDNLIAIGDSVGSLTIMDLQMSDESYIKFIGNRGFTGSPSGIVSIQKHPSLPLFSTLSMDRLIRMYRFENKTNLPEKTAFIKTRSKCFVMLNDNFPEEPDSSEDDWAELPEENDGIWDNYTVCSHSKM